MSAQPPYRPPTSPPPGYPPRRSGRGPVIAGAVVALVIVGALGYWLGGRGTGTPSAGQASPTVTASAPAASGVPSPAASQQPSAAAPTSGAAATSASPTRTSTAAPITSATQSHSASPTVTPFSHPDPDFGYVTGVSTSGSVTRLSFDRATRETGAAAASAAAAHGQTVQDDYFIVNDNKLIRTFELSPSVVVMGSGNLVGEVGPKASTLAALEAWVKANPALRLPVNLTYDATGKVTKITEVYFP
ncbi:MAG: hypothetical protein QOF39_939 [Frankiales bacterium]|nr:hypothetical protein [Frankiales bacterium]